MVTSNDPDTEDVLLVVKDLKPFYTALGREARLEINLSHTTNGETSTPSHRAAAHEGLEDVWLFKSSHYGPNLQVTGSQKKKLQSARKFYGLFGNSSEGNWKFQRGNWWWD